MLEKKRKRDNEAHRSSKKVALSSLTGAEIVKISIFADDDQWAPILGTLNYIVLRQHCTREEADGP